MRLLKNLDALIKVVDNIDAEGQVELRVGQPGAQTQRRRPGLSLRAWAASLARRPGPSGYSQSVRKEREYSYPSRNPLPKHMNQPALHPWRARRQGVPGAEFAIARTPPLWTHRS